MGPPMENVAAYIIEEGLVFHLIFNIDSLTYRARF